MLICTSPPRQRCSLGKYRAYAGLWSTTIATPPRRSARNITRGAPTHEVAAAPHGIPLLVTQSASPVSLRLYFPLRPLPCDANRQGAHQVHHAREREHSASERGMAVRRVQRVRRVRREHRCGAGAAPSPWRSTRIDRGCGRKDTGAGESDTGGGIQTAPGGCPGTPDGALQDAGGFDTPDPRRRATGASAKSAILAVTGNQRRGSVPPSGVIPR